MQVSADQRALPTSGALGPVVAETQAMFDALFSGNSGPSAPALPVKGMSWLDTTTAAAHLLKLYDGANWITLGTLDPVSHTFVQAVSAGGTGGKTAAEARAALGITGFRKLAEIDCAAVNTSLLIYDLPDDVKRFRVELEGVGPASGDALIFMRCGVAGSPADAGSGDYFQQLINGEGSTLVTGGDAISYAPIATVGSNGLGGVTAWGSVGTPQTGWQVKSFGRTSYTGGNQITPRGAARQLVGIRRRLVIQSNAPLVKGDILIEVK